MLLLANGPTLVLLPSVMTQVDATPPTLLVIVVAAGGTMGVPTVIGWLGAPGVLEIQERLQEDAPSGNVFVRLLIEDDSGAPVMVVVTPLMTEVILTIDFVELDSDSPPEIVLTVV